MIATEILVMLVAIVGMSMTTIGVVSALFVRLDRRIDGVYHKLDAKMSNLVEDVVDLRVAVARIEGYLEARDGFATAAVDPAPPSVPVE